MKKVILSFVASICLILTFALAACNQDNSGTYYPTVNEMAANLEKKGYRTQFAIGERNAEGCGYVVDSLDATKDDDYIYFYWIEDATYCNVYYDKLQELHPDCPNFALIENDDIFGNIVYCGTNNAVKAAGIKVVKVDVNVKI